MIERILLHVDAVAKATVCLNRANKLKTLVKFWQKYVNNCGHQSYALYRSTSYGFLWHLYTTFY